MKQFIKGHIYLSESGSTVQTTSYPLAKQSPFRRQQKRSEDGTDHSDRSRNSTASLPTHVNVVVFIYRSNCIFTCIFQFAISTTDTSETLYSAGIFTFSKLVLHSFVYPIRMDVYLRHIHLHCCKT